MSTQLPAWKQWFVYDYHRAAGRPKLEDAVMEYAMERFLYCLVYEKDLPDLVSHLKSKQDKLFETNRRTRKVDIHLSRWRDEPHASIIIGEQSIRLRKVAGEHETIDPVFTYASKIKTL